MPSADPLSGIGSVHRIKAEQYWDVPRSLSPNQSRASAICNDCPRRLATTDPSHRCQTGPYSFAVDFSLSSPTPSSTSECAEPPGQLASGSQPGPVEQHAAAATWPRADRKTGRPRGIGDAARAMRLGKEGAFVPKGCRLATTSTDSAPARSGQHGDLLAAAT